MGVGEVKEEPEFSARNTDDSFEAGCSLLVVRPLTVACFTPPVDSGLTTGQEVVEMKIRLAPRSKRYARVG